MIILAAKTWLTMVMRLCDSGQGICARQCLNLNKDPSGVGSGSVSDRSAIARHEASFYKLAEWSEQLRPVTSVRLGAVRCRVQIRLCTEQRV